MGTEKMLETTEEIPQLDHTIGADGKERPRHINKDNEESTEIYEREQRYEPLGGSVRQYGTQC